MRLQISHQTMMFKFLDMLFSTFGVDLVAVYLAVNGKVSKYFKMTARDVVLVALIPRKM